STSNVRLFLRSGYGLVKIPNDIIQVLDSDGDPHQVLGDTGFQLLVVTQLLVRGGSGMDNKALGVSQVGQMREKLHRIDEFSAGFKAALDTERHDRSGAFGQIFLRQLVV